MARFFLPLALLIVSIAPNFVTAAHHEGADAENPIIQSLIKGYSFVRGDVMNKLEGLTDEQINFIAEIDGNQYNNSIAMLAHHLVNTEVWICGLLSDEDVEFETVEDPFAVTNATVDDVKAALQKSFDHVITTLESMTDADLAQDGIKLGETQFTKGESVQVLIVHAGTHGGQMTVLKRLQGL